MLVEISHEEVVQQILKELQKDNTTREGKLIIRAEQIPPVLLQKKHKMYKSCKNKLYQRRYKQLKRDNTISLRKELFKEEGFIGNSRKGGSYVRWSRQEVNTLLRIVDEFGHDIGCTKASKELGRSFNSCKCKYSEVTKGKKRNRVVKPKNTTPEIKPVSLDVSKDITNLDIQGYKIKITYKNGSVFTYNMETQQISIK